MKNFGRGLWEWARAWQGIGCSTRAALVVLALACVGGAERSIAAVPESRAPAVVSHAVPNAAPPSQEWSLPGGLFSEPLVPTGSTLEQENQDLARALLAYRDAIQRSGAPDAVEPVLAFLAAHPSSAWKPALQLDLGIIYRQTGHFSKALEIWQTGWRETRGLRDAHGRALANDMVARLSQLEAYLGRKELLAPLLDSIHTRTVGGTAAQLITDSHTGLYEMEHEPENSFRCGPLALERIVNYTSAHSDVAQSSPATLKVLDEAHSTDHGLSLSAVREIAAKAGMQYQMAFRTPGAVVLMPAVAHWKVGHYAAIVDRLDGRYLVQDTTFGDDLRVSQATLDEEASGYFLVPVGALPEGWRSVSKAEGAKVWGRGDTGQQHDPGDTGCDCAQSGDSTGGDDTTSSPGTDAASGGAATAASTSSTTGGGNALTAGYTTSTVELQVVGLQLHDTPVGYVSPIGPAVRFALFYSHRDTQQPTTFSYTNFGPKWTFTWLSYITDNVSSNATATLYPRGGGSEPFNFSSTSATTSAPGPYSQANLTRSVNGSGSTTGFTLTFPDGSFEYFKQANPAVSNQFLMTAVGDPAGNTVTVNYQTLTVNGTAVIRISSLTDAIGQVSTLTYGVSSNPLLVTQITDPFGRSAILTYNSSGLLAGITDVLGITSSYTYGQGTDPDFINTLTTPYGSTRFSYGDASTNSALGSTRFLQTVDPLGRTSYVEFDQGNVIPGDVTTANSGSLINPALMPTGMNTCDEYLYYRNTFVFDPNQFAQAYQGSSLNYSLAHVIHWLHTSDGSTTSRFKESEKQPLENRVWYNYPGQTNCILAPVSSGGTVAPNASSQPSAIGRVLDDGTTQIQSFSYNPNGNVTVTTDPVGRQITYTYASNNIDRLAVTNTTGGGSQLLETRTYNGQHLPLTITGANGRISRYAYNAAGQQTTSTDPLGRVTTMTYDVSGHLLTLRGPVSGAETSYAYDNVGRVAAVTDAAGMTVRFAYDPADRLTSSTFPDGTRSQLTYHLLDWASATDRLGQTTTYSYDADRELIKTTDPLGNTVQQGYNLAGRLNSLTDSNGHTTTWVLDAQSRVTAKQFADGTSQSMVYEGSLSLVAALTDALGQIATYTYNRDNTTATLSFSANQPTPSVSFAWDPAYRRVVSMTDGTGTTTYRYYPVSSSPVLGANRLRSVSSPIAGMSGTDTITYSYDALNRDISYNIDGVVQSVSYDVLGRVISANNPLDSFTYSYSDSTNRVSGISSSQGPALALSYFGPTGDELLQQISASTPSGTSLAQFGYTYDSDDNVTSLAVSSPTAQTISYTYDAGNRLRTGLISGSSTPQYAYVYDPASNLTSITTGGSQGSYSYSATNALASGTYDANGSPSSLSGNAYSWDGANRLVSFTGTTGLTSTFTYDGLGRLVRVVDSTGGTITADHSYFWCGSVRCLAHDNTQSGSPVSTQYFDQGMIANGTPYYYIKDRLGSVSELVTTSGGVAAQYTYDPYGNPTTVSGNVVSDIGYAGYFYHAASGLNFALYRSYDPSHARWLNRDPLTEAGGVNLYAYLASGPLSADDPLGLAPCTIDLNQLVHNAKAGTIDPKTKMPRTQGGGNCALTVKGDISNAGGPTLPHLGKNPATGKDNTPTPGAYGPTLINSGCYQQVPNAGYVPHPGDIAIAVGNGSSHISIYDGNAWDADIQRPDAIPGTGPKYAGATVTYYQYIGNNNIL